MPPVVRKLGKQQPLRLSRFLLMLQLGLVLTSATCALTSLAKLSRGPEPAVVWTAPSCRRGP
jgi:hypothetical protein